MKEKQYYSIGEAGRICNISGKTLRYYDQIGLISPDKTGENDYRYYSRGTLLSIPVIKYYKQMGFSLSEVQELLRGRSFSALERDFRKKLSDLEAERTRLREKEVMLSDWYDLIVEAGVVTENRVTEAGIKYFKPARYCVMEQPYNPDYRDAIINIEFTNYLEQIGNEATGPVVRHFASFREKMAGESRTSRILQRTIRPCAEDTSSRFAGGLMLSCYHIGEHERLNETYEKMMHWADRHGYHCGEGAYERYIADYWTTNQQSQFVTEVVIKISR